MVHVQFANLHSRPMEFLDFTSVTLDAFQQLVPPVEAACQAPMAGWRLDGKPRTTRRFSVYQNCPFSTPEERLLFILAYVKTYSLSGGPGTPLRHGPKQSPSVDARAPARAAGGPACPWRCPRPLPDGPGPAARCLEGRHRRRRLVGGGAGPRRPARLPPCAHDGTERRIVRPQDPAAQKEC